MNTKVIGQFLAELRKEQRLTQEQLGEKLGVTNKTVSRWENGNYLPPVEMLQQLSGLYNITINEILCGERLTDSQYRERAEENIKTALDNSAFTVKDKIHYYRRKWLAENGVGRLLWFLCYVIMAILSVIYNPQLVPHTFVFISVYLVKIYIDIKKYVDEHVYNQSK